MTKKRIACEHVEAGKRCRKSSVTIKIYQRLLGHNIGPMGETPVYMPKAIALCECHKQSHEGVDVARDVFLSAVNHA